MGLVVVGLDGSACGRVAFQQAVQEAIWRDAKLRAVHVAGVPVIFGYPNTGVDPTVMMEAAEGFLGDEVDRLTADHYDGDLPVPCELVVVQGHAGAELVEATADAELLVVGSRGLGGVRSVLAGSVATYCLHHLTCPLLVVRADDD